MKYLRSIYLCLNLSFIFLSILNSAVIDNESSMLKTQKARTPWTVLIFAASDNDLYPWFEMNLAAMEAVGSNTNLNILVYLCKHPQGEAKVGQKILVNSGGYKVLEETADVDSGDENTAIKAIQWACTDFPSKKLMVIFWDHGAAWRKKVKGACFDNTTGNNLTDVKIKNACDYIAKNYRKIDVVGFDACLMAASEIAYILQSSAKYLVASEQTIPDDGFDYQSILSLLAASDMDAKTLASKMVSIYSNYYDQKNESYSLSAIDLGKFSDVVNTLNNATTNLLNKIQNPSNTADLIKSQFINAVGETQSFDDPTMVDLDNLMTNLLDRVDKIGFSTTKDKISFQRPLKAVIYAIANSIIANKHSSDLADANGLSIYFPSSLSNFDSAYNSTVFAKNVSWNKLINAVLE